MKDGARTIAIAPIARMLVFERDDWRSVTESVLLHFQLVPVLGLEGMRAVDVQVVRAETALQPHDNGRTLTCRADVNNVEQGEVETCGHSVHVNSSCTKTVYLLKPFTCFLSQRFVDESDDSEHALAEILALARKTR